ncbi:MAG: hypothetical protein MUF34_37855, partial [Polyangiaceae bacterium]|nr:hypothetical protein [Polyangiaceae bacterium]
MLEAFRVMPPQFHTIREALFADWRTLIVRRTLPLGQNGAPVPCGGWVSALVDAAREGPAGAASFHAAVRAALEEARVASAAEPKPGWKQRWVFVDPSATPLFALAILTHDLDATERTLKKAAPKLFKLLDAHDAHDKGHLATTRRAWCTRL